MAVARWLQQHGVRATVLEARSAADVARVAEARQTNRPAERLIALCDISDGTDLDGGSALRVARKWLEHLSPIEQRGAVEVLEENRVAQATGHEQLNELLRKSIAGDLKIKRAARGRPKGANPFRGVGFDIIVAMLCQPDEQWTERELAALVDRSPSAVNRILRELRQRGYVHRSRGASRIHNVEILRDDLLAAWRGSVAERPGHVLSCPSGTDPKDLVVRVQSEGERILLAGVSACDSPGRLLEQIVTIYADQQAMQALTQLGCENSVAGMGDIAVWEPLERAIFYAPRDVGRLAATNRVVTYLDLAVGKSERHLNAARAVWGET